MFWAECYKARFASVQHLLHELHLLLLPRKTLHQWTRWGCSRSEIGWRWNHWTWRAISNLWWRGRRHPRGHSNRSRRRCLRRWWRNLWRGWWNLSWWSWWSTRNSSPIRQSSRGWWWFTTFRRSWLEVQLQLLPKA
jgi:hypothetical protein